MSIEIIEKPTHKCSACGCVFSFDKEDFIESDIRADRRELSRLHYIDTYLHRVFVTCPICDTVHVLKEVKTTKDAWA